jgi:MFS family permease
VTDLAAEPTGLKVLRDRNFWPYLAGTFFSGCGTWFQNIAQALLVYRLTKSTFLVGVVGFAQFSGTLLLAPWAGAAADRYDRKRVLITAHSASIVVTVVLALLAAADLASTGVVIGLAFLVGLMGAFSTPAMLSLVPLLVPEQEIRGAIALNAATFNLARAVGPVAGAYVVESLGIPWAFAINAVSYVVLIGALQAVHPRPVEDRPEERPKLRESIALVRGDAYLGMLLLAVMVVAITSDPVQTLTPGFATEIFGHKDSWAGVLIGGFGTGAVLAALSAGRMRDPQRTLVKGLSLLATGTLLFALAPNILIGTIGMIVAGYGYLTSSTTTTAALQLGVAQSQRGRIMAIWSVAFVGVRPFASLVDGGIASGVGLREAAVVLALPAVVMGAVLALRRGGTRGASAPSPASQHPGPPDG